MSEEQFELVQGSGNVYRDFGDVDADVRQAKALLAAEIIKVLEKEDLSKIWVKTPSFYDGFS
ncbi:MAG: helix-turn-helix domain-containing protein [Dolichospermum sp.]|uniref:XRE family transcriptional regulator n=1 Tax=Microcystis aeruginosa 11-30S32 TaxID=2358142 RepID=A0A510PL55_MICAE|nr:MULTISPECIES: helix-turn-helix domain-containing protein [Microcystis]MCZ8226069.1 helix-turn-helix domain-containing protein [Microcystis sp. LE19-84.1B]GCA94562.1 XRE family transcriptional regulator [Microcystis aeruginosa 11-30S32]